MRFVVVTGLSGAGKSTTLNFLEDSGYYCVDNLPVQLISEFARLINENDEIDTNFAINNETFKIPVEIKLTQHIDK